MKMQHQRTLSKANADLEDELNTFSGKDTTREKPVVPRIEPPRVKPPSEEKKHQVEIFDNQPSKTEESKGSQGKTRYEEIMSYLGNIEDEFSQMSITNRSVLHDNSPAGGRLNTPS